MTFTIHIFKFFDILKSPHDSPEATKNQKDKIPEHNVLLYNVTQKAFYKNGSFPNVIQQRWKKFYQRKKIFDM